MKSLISMLITLISLTMIVCFFWGSILSIFQVILTGDFKIISLAVWIYLLALFISSVRLRQVFRSYGIINSITKFFFLTMIGQFFNNFLPTSIGGDSIKAIYAANRDDKIPEAILAVVIDRVIGLMTVGFCTVVSMFVFPEIRQQKLLYYASIFLLVCIMIAIVIFYSKKINVCMVRWVEGLPFYWSSYFAKAFRETSAFLRNGRVFFSTLVISVLILLTFAFSMWLSAIGIGINVEYNVFFLLIAMVSFFSLVPSVNGAGIREGIFIIVLSEYILPEKALALSVIFYGMGVVCSILGGFLFVSRHRLGIQVNPHIKSRAAAILQNKGRKKFFKIFRA